LGDQRVRRHRRMLTPSSTRDPGLVYNEFAVVRNRTTYCFEPSESFG
jgi:hypothetical protein